MVSMSSMDIIEMAGRGTVRALSVLGSNTLHRLGASASAARKYILYAG